MSPVACFGQLLPVTLPSPDQEPASEVWEAYFKHAQFEDVQQSRVVMGSVFGESGEVEAERCMQQKEMLQQALEKVPVSIALWYVAMECAQASSNEAAGERAFAAFAALSRHALAANPEPYKPGKPIPIVGELDAWLLVNALGWEPGYAWYDVGETGPYLSLRISAFDPEAKREHLLRFDEMDTLQRVLLRDGDELTPSFVLTYRRAMLMQDEAAAGPAASAAGRMLQLVAGQNEDSLPAQLGVLAGAGDFSAARALFLICIANQEQPCAETAVDALLGFAELELAVPTAMLAIAHAEGRGVRRDRKAAEQLLDRADQRLGEHRASLLMAEEWITAAGESTLPGLLETRLKNLAEAGNAAAGELLLLLELRELGRAKPTLRKLDRLQRAASASDPRVRGLYAALRARAGDLGAMPLLRAAVEASDPRSARDYVSIVEKQLRLVDSDTDAAADVLAAHRIAGLHGDSRSSLRAGELHLAAGRRGLAQQWFASAFVQGQPEAGYHAARLTVDGGAGVQGGAREAAVILEAVLASTAHPPSRRLLAELLMEGDEGLEPNPARAATLLRQSIAAGDDEARRMLADAVLRGRIEAAEGEQPERVLRDAVERGDTEAMDNLAMHIRSGRIEGSSAQAIELWKQAADAGLVRARNNLAWHLCTIADPAERDIAAGLAEARAMAELGDLPAGFLDTVWTCHANAGERQAAIEGQKALIESLRAEGVGAEVLAYFEDKLGYFERGELFLEAARANDAGAATPSSESAAD
jgi:TPR repeat protein